MSRFYPGTRFSCTSACSHTWSSHQLEIAVHRAQSAAKPPLVPASSSRAVGQVSADSCLSFIESKYIRPCLISLILAAWEGYLASAVCPEDPQHKPVSADSCRNTFMQWLPKETAEPQMLAPMLLQACLNPPPPCILVYPRFSQQSARSIDSWYHVAAGFGRARGS